MRYRAYFSNIDDMNIQSASGILGVSVRGQDKYKGDQFEAILDLFAGTARSSNNKFNKIFVLIGDGLNAFNDARNHDVEQPTKFDSLTLETFDSWAGILRKKAKKFRSVAVQEGKAWMDNEGQKLAEKFEKSNIDYQFISYEGIRSTAKHVKLLKRIEDKYKSDEKFRQLIHKDAIAYYIRHHRGTDKQKIEIDPNAIAKIPIEVAYSILAVLEEIAITAQALTDYEIPYFIYPGKALGSLEYLLEEDKKISSKIKNMSCLRIQVKLNKQEDKKKTIADTDDSPRDSKTASTTSTGSAGSNKGSDAELSERAVVVIQGIVDSNKDDPTELAKFVRAYTKKNKIKTKAVVKVISDYFKQEDYDRAVLAAFVDAYDSDDEDVKEKIDVKQPSPTGSPESTRANHSKPQHSIAGVTMFQPVGPGPSTDLEIIVDNEHRNKRKKGSHRSDYSKQSDSAVVPIDTMETTTVATASSDDDVEMKGSCFRFKNLFK